MPTLADDTATRQARPLEINLVTGGYILYALISAAVLTLFILNRDAVANAVRVLNPGFSQSQIDASVTSIQLIVVGAHIFFGACFFCLAFLIHSGKNWVRVTGSIITVLALLQTIYEWSSPTDVPAVLRPDARLDAVFVQILMLLLILIGVALQWLPQASRDFFTVKKRQEQ